MLMLRYATTTTKIVHWSAQSGSQRTSKGELGISYFVTFSSVYTSLSHFLQPRYPGIFVITFPNSYNFAANG